MDPSITKDASQLIDGVGASQCARTAVNVTPVLPPCRVCGEKASGFHYGVNTCEACKGFFRRMFSRSHMFKCPGGGKCTIRLGTRKACSPCRYQKCLNAGMSKQAIRTGRYTHEKKTKDTNEVKQLTLLGMVNRDDMVLLLPEDRQTVLQNIINSITRVHMQHTPHTSEFLDRLQDREAQFLECRALQKEVFGTMRPLTHTEYQHVYQTTGLDIDGRREMIRNMLIYVENTIKCFVPFAKSLPGFRDLPLDDQIELLKAGYTAFDMAESYHIYNADQQIYVDVSTVFHMHDWHSCVDPESIARCDRLLCRLQALDLTPTEQQVFIGIAVMSADVVLSNEARMYVDSSQEVLTDALRMLLERNHDDADTTYYRCHCIIVDMVTVAKQLGEVERFIMDEYSDISYSPLIQAIF